MINLRITGIVLIAIDAIVLFAFFYSLSRALKFRPHFTMFTKPPTKTLTLRDAVLKERWQGIVARVTGSRSMDTMKLAVIDADKICDDVLRRLGLGGQHMADRISQLDQEEFSSVKRLWDAHRFRNNLVHTPGYPVSREQAQRTIEDYQAFLKEVGIL
ncbi:MAG: hypothetical protein HY435_02250 [Candidatus Liptonbacteria bacterium]|nr:hypothetical protein [Candidatus Liptonbacteria bacterium]